MHNHTSLCIWNFCEFAFVHTSSCCVTQSSVLPRILRKSGAHVPRLHDREIPSSTTSQSWRYLGGFDVFRQCSKVIPTKNVKFRSCFGIDPALR
jgi:hypothetical protein